MYTPDKKEQKKEPLDARGVPLKYGNRLNRRIMKKIFDKEQQNKSRVINVKK